MPAEGGLPESPLILPPLHLPAVPGAAAVDSYAASFWLLATGIIIVLALIVRITAAVSPGRVQNLVEWLVETVEDTAVGVVGEAAQRFMPFFAALFFFILLSNLMGLIPGCMSPTASYHTNFAMAILVALVSQYAGIKTHGFIGYLKHIGQPPPCPWPIKWFLMSWLWPLLHILEQVIRPVSLTMRLFGNIFAKEILLLILALVTIVFLRGDVLFVRGLSAVPFLLRVFIILLGTLVSIVQATVFTMLTMVFIALSMEGHEEGEGHSGA
jgi:F-type H+-transporting ATPase subunit a